jgi:hypothetical protein
MYINAKTKQESFKIINLKQVSNFRIQNGVLSTSIREKTKNTTTEIKLEDAVSSLDTIKTEYKKYGFIKIPMGSLDEIYVNTDKIVSLEYRIIEDDDIKVKHANNLLYSQADKQVVHFIINFEKGESVEIKNIMYYISMIQKEILKGG